MADILIANRGTRVIIIPDTPKGERWIKANVVLTYGTAVFISKEFLEDFIKELEKADLIYEEV